MQEEKTGFSRQLNKNIHLIKEGLHNTSDLIIRTLQIGVSTHRHEVAIVYIDAIVNSQIIRDGIVTPLLNIQSNNDKENLIQNLAYCHIRSESIQILQSVNESLVGISGGKSIVLIDGYDSGINSITKKQKLLNLIPYKIKDKKNTKDSNSARSYFLTVCSDNHFT